MNKGFNTHQPMNQIKSKGNLLILAMLVLIPFNVAGQRTMEIEEIRVIAPYEPSISDAFKINFNPSITDTASVQMDFDYAIIPQKLLTRFQLPPMQAARLRGEPIPNLLRGYAKAGYGNYQSPYFEGFFNTLQSDKHALGLQLKHQSSNADLNDYKYSHFSENMAALTGNRFFRNATLSGQVSFDRQVLHHYGFPFPTSSDSTALGNIRASDLRQRHQLLSSGIGYGSHHTNKSRTGYNMNVSHQWFTDRFDVNEHHLGFVASIERHIDRSPLGRGFSHIFQMEASAHYLHTDNLMGQSGAGIYSLKPLLVSEINTLRFHVGVNVSVEDDAASYTMRAWPLAGLELAIVPEKFLGHIQISGNIEGQSQLTLSRENPFVGSSPQMEFTNIRYRIHGGFKGSIGDGAGYSLSVTNSLIDNQPFFINNFIEGSDDPALLLPYPNNAFAVVYDNIRQLNVRAEVYSRLGSNFSFRLAGDYFEYSMDNLQEAWHMPTITASLNLKYNYRNTLLFSADIFGRDRTFGQILELGPEGAQLPLQSVRRKNHDFYLDANVGVEYRYTRRLSFFANFHNLQNESIERWTHYPTHGFHFLGGVTYSF